MMKFVPAALAAALVLTGCAATPRAQTATAPATPAPVAAEIARLSLFLTTPAARHITGQTLHVSHGALAQFA